MKLLRFSTGPSIRTRKVQREYDCRRSSQNSTGCDFCNREIMQKQMIAEFDYFFIIRNIMPYAIWDECRVVEHLLLVPKRHVVSTGEFTKQETLEYMRLSSTWEQQGYSTFSRPTGGVTRSVIHQHTHLIKTEKRRLKSIIFNATPHILWFR